MTANTTNKDNLAAGTTISKANAIRTKVARDHGVPIKFIFFGDCIRVASGAKSFNSIRDCWGYRLGTNLSNLAKTLLCDPETPTFFFSEDVGERSGIRKSTLGAYLYDLCVAGRVRNDGQLFSVVERPFPQPVFS